MKKIGIVLAILVASARAALAVDFKIIDYGAVCDAKTTIFATLTQGSQIVTGPSGTWSGGDVGKKVWCIPIGVGLLGAVSIPATATISSVDNSGQIHASVAATNTGASVVLGFCGWTSHDDTAAFASAFTASIATFDVNVGGTAPGRIVMPSGGCAVSGRIYNNLGTAAAAVGPSLAGEGQIATTIYLMPNFVVPVDGGGALIQNAGFGARFADFGFSTLDWAPDLASGQDMVRFTQTTKLEVERVRAFYVGSGVSSFGTAAVAFRGCSSPTVRGLRVQDGPAGSFMSACHLVQTNGSFYDSVCSNMAVNLLVENNQGRDSVTAPLNWWGGIIDEPGMVIANGGQINMWGTVIYSNDGFSLGPGVELRGNSRLWIHDGNVGRFNSALNTGGYAATIEEGSVIYSQGMTWRANTGGNTGSKAIVNNGTMVDEGGNEYWLCGPSTACVTKTAAQLVTGNQPVKK